MTEHSFQISALTLEHPQVFIPKAGGSTQWPEGALTPLNTEGAWHSFQ